MSIKNTILSICKPSIKALLIFDSIFNFITLIIMTSCIFIPIMQTNFFTLIILMFIIKIFVLESYVTRILEKLEDKGATK